MAMRRNRSSSLICLLIIVVGLVWTFAIVFCPLWPTKPRFASKQALALNQQQVRLHIPVTMMPATVPRRIVLKSRHIGRGSQQTKIT